MQCGAASFTVARETEETFQVRRAEIESILVGLKIDGYDSPRLQIWQTQVDSTAEIFNAETEIDDFLVQPGETEDTSKFDEPRSSLIITGSKMKIGMADSHGLRIWQTQVDTTAETSNPETEIDDF